MAINHQFVLKNQARTVVPNRVIAHLAARPYLGKTLGENVIFMFNRAEDDRLQNLLLRFLYTVFRSEETAGFFYTNDLRIILDVILRECRTISTDDHALLHGYLSVMTLLLRDPALHSYKPRDTRRLLEDLGAPSPAPPSPLPAPPASPRTARRPPPPPPPRRSCSSASSSSTSSSFSSSSKPFTPVTPSSPASSATAAASSLRAASDPIPDPATAPSGSWTPRRLAAAVLRDHPDYFSGA
ncbi:hypothetical protein HK405_004139 [Cladochytrium tenue]|nr:hypothetical protein HK405_004139 [Cladochytrium tenue]